jgi:phosphoribosylformylglycinamidine (FGAM) synthase PurS component
MNNLTSLNALKILIFLVGSPVFAQIPAGVKTTQASKKYEEKLVIDFIRAQDTFKKAVGSFVPVTSDTRCAIQAYHKIKTKDPATRAIKESWAKLPSENIDKIKSLKFRYSLRGINDPHGTATTLAVHSKYYFEANDIPNPARIEITCLQNKLFADHNTCSQPEILNDPDVDLSVDLATKTPNLDQEIKDTKAIYDRYYAYTSHKRCISQHLERLEKLDLKDQFEAIGKTFFTNPKITDNSGGTVAPSTANPPGRS